MSRPEGGPPRAYRMRKRGEAVNRTRQRITDAAVRLHTSIGPSRASMSAVADKAGVTRVTLYRHFPSMDELFTACMTDWRALHPPPDVERWRAIPGLRAAAADGARRALPLVRPKQHGPVSDLPRCRPYPGIEPARATSHERAPGRCDPRGLRGHWSSGEAPPRRDRPRRSLLDVALVGQGPGTLDARGSRVVGGLRPGGEALGARLVAPDLAQLRRSSAARGGAAQAGESVHRALTQSHARELRRRASCLGEARAERIHLGMGLGQASLDLAAVPGQEHHLHDGGGQQGDGRESCECLSRCFHDRLPGTTVRDGRGAPRWTATIGPGVKTHHPRAVGQVVASSWRMPQSHDCL